MNRDQVKSLFKIVSLSYPQFEVSKDKVDVWLLSLRDEEFETVKANLICHIKTNPYPPKIADIIKRQPIDEKFNVPDVVETRKMLDELSNKEIAPYEVRQQALNEMAVILGIKRRKETQ